MTNAHETRQQIAEIRLLTSLEAYTRLDRKRNEDKRHELAVRPVKDVMREYRQKCIDMDHVERMNP